MICVCIISSSGGVKEMEGFREYFNLSRIEENTTCRANDDEETNVVLVNLYNDIEISNYSLNTIFRV